MKILVSLGSCSFHMPCGPLRPIDSSISWREHGECSAMLCSRGLKETPIFCFPILKTEIAGILGLDCRQRKAAPQGAWSTYLFLSRSSRGTVGCSKRKSTLHAMLFQESIHSQSLLAFLACLIF